MFKDITLGQYYPGESVIHKLDPRTKLSGTMLFLISLFINDKFIGLGLAFLFLATMVRISGVPARFITRGLKGIFLIVLITVLFSVFYVNTGTLLVEFWVFKIYSGGLSNAAFIAIRIMLLVLGSSLMTLTTTPTRLTDGLEKGLRCLNVIRFPVHSLAMIMSIALRFIPILTQEMDTIQKAQMARGADFEKRGFMRRIRGFVPLLVPLIISAFRRAADLAQAMDARCYHGGKGRTKMKPLRYARRDFIGYLVLFSFLAVTVAIRLMPYGY